MRREAIGEKGDFRFKATNKGHHRIKISFLDIELKYQLEIRTEEMLLTFKL